MKNKTLTRIIKMAKPHMKPIILVAILSLVVNIGEIVRPYLLEVVIDDYLSKGIYQNGHITIGIIGAIYIGIVLLENMINFIATTTTNMTGEEVIYTLRNKLFKYTQNAGIPFHDKTSAGTLFVRITNDIEDISTLFKDVISTIIKDIVLIIAIMGIMIYFSYSLSLLSFIVIPFIILFSLICTMLLNKIYDKSKMIRTNLNVFLAESIYGAKIIKIFNIQKEKQDECEKLTKDFRDERAKERNC